MKRITLLLTLLLLLPVVASAQLKVGVMNPDEVLDAMPEATQVQSQLEQFIEQRQNNFQSRYQDWISALTEYSELMEAGALNEQQQLEHEESLAENQEELNNMQILMQQQIQTRQAELFNPLLVKVEEAMASVSEELGLDFVLNRTSNTGDPIVFYASERAQDITQKVIEKVNQN